MSVEFLDRYDGILPNLPRSYGRVCCICGRDITYSRDGTPVWYRYKDENGDYTGEWKCHNCKRKSKGYKFKKLKCRLCKSDKTRIQSNGKSIWIKDLDITKKFTGEYLCYKCAYEENRPTCEHTNRIYKIYDDNGIWTGRRKCKICSE
jgi:hypothetical protein